jgi:hypothetical protein
MTALLSSSPKDYSILEMKLERSDDVLWSLALPGVVLHHLRTREYLVLDELGYRLWAFLDGGRDVADAIERAVRSEPNSEERQRALQVVQTLAAHNFVVETASL